MKMQFCCFYTYNLQINQCFKFFSFRCPFVNGIFIIFLTPDVYYAANTPPPLLPLPPTNTTNTKISII